MIKHFTPAELTMYTGCSWNTRDLPKEALEICFDSRKLKENQLFWPLKGESFDAHDFIEPLMEKGHIYFVADKEWLLNRPDIPGVILEVMDTNLDLGVLASNYATSLECKKIAITGSNGKTTTKEMIKAVLGEKASATKGNLNNHIGVPFTLLDLNDSYDYAIVEAGTNHPGEIEYLSKIIKPDVCVITNIGESHLEFLIDKNGVYKEKINLMNHMSEEGLIVLCADDPFLKKYVPHSKNNLISYGIRSGMLRPFDLEWKTDGCAKYNVDGVEFELKAPGEHNLLNALCATVIGKYYNIDLNTIAERLNNWIPSQMRSEMENYNGMVLYKDCYNSNPTSVKAALKVLALKESEKRKVLVFGDMFELGPNARNIHESLVQNIVDVKLDKIFLCGEYSQYLYEKLQLKENTDVQYFKNIEELGEVLKKELELGDLVLFKASRGMKFDLLIKSIKGS